MTTQREAMDAAISGNRLIVRLPLWQIGTLIAAGATVMFSVWLTTRDLGKQVNDLSASVDGLRISVATHRESTDALKERVIKLETRLDRDY